MIQLFVRRISIFLLLAAIGIAAGAYWWDQIDGLLQKSQVQSQKRPESESSLCYRLPDKGWLNFLLPPWTDQIKILSNAEFAKDFRTAKNATHRYALSYEVIDDRGEKIQSGVYHHKTEITSYRIPGKERKTPLNHYVDSLLKPADGKQIKINLKPVIQQSNVSRLRLKLYSAEAGIKSVVVRVYTPEYHSGREITYLWNRLPRKTRQRLAKGNVYPPEFLSQSEKQNLVRKLWRPEAPEGIEGREYQRQRLYRISTEEAIPEKDQPIVPEGLVVSPMHRATVPVPHDGWRLRFKIRRMNASSPKPYTIGIRWHGKDVGQTRQQSLSLKESPAQYTADYDGGLIELWADARVNIQMYAVSEKSENATEKRVEPTSMYLRTYRAGLRQPVVYAVNHSRGQSTPFRADFRVLANKTRQPDARVTCELVNSAGKNIKRHFRITAPLSRYDRLPGQTKADFVSKPVSRYFLLPKNISRIRFSSPDAVLVSGYNRPLNLPKTTRVPEDYYAKARHMESQPTWFLFKPENYRDLYLNHRSVLLTLQYHPPKRDPRLLKGVYNWEAFRPTGNWSGAFLFAPRDADQPLRKQALNAAYAPIALNRVLNVVLQSPQSLKVIRPELVYFTNDGIETPLQFYVNDRLHFTHEITGPRGRVTLPAMPSGKNRIRVKAPPKTRVYLNHILSKRPDHMLRFANRIDDSGLSFAFYKQTAGEESLSLKLFFPYGEPDRSVFRVTLESAADRSIGPYKKLSILERKFIVRPPENSTKVPVMQSESGFVTSGQTFFYPFGDDLPRGKYRVNIDLVSGPGGYIQMYRVLPGNYTKRSMKKEPILNHETD
ncbi:MAG: hypothetical protein KGY42_09280 [Desulfobacterales bacterium]|nr:hypothetical protein [Desulfobacterales bacterium]